MAFTLNFERAWQTWLVCLAIGVAAVMISIAIIASPRWQIVYAQGTVVRLDRWTGEMKICEADELSPGHDVFCNMRKEP